ncbi:hypothetical protein C1645_828283 [Glomus cerebriforme]|uniref:Uncharacterized protein n=1 Tax=Glomus cerebriforme TaxID=658196 RepID=A0A397ST13_9GLOM|nr:hypothetical protein C1645_828283 [Glomus cerebriforme]
MNTVNLRLFLTRIAIELRKAIDHFKGNENQFQSQQSKDIVFEWIPYDQFNDIKRLDEDVFSIIYSAIWKDGPLNYDDDDNDNKYENIRSQQY